MHKPKDPFSIKSDGSINIKRIGTPPNRVGDFYHNLMRMPWWQFFILFSITYLAINIFFASLYFFEGSNILNARPDSFWDAFLFSFQTSSTIGYGHLLPKTNYAHAVVIFDSLSGILFVAIATGLAFAKFSRPSARVLFTKNIILTHMNGQKALQFRMGNARKSEIVSAEIEFIMSRPETTKEGMSFRKIYDLKLERNHSPLFSFSWLVTHVIDETSPLYSYEINDYKEAQLIFIVSLTGIDDIFSQTVHNRNFYIGDDVIEAKQFQDVMGVDSQGIAYIDYSIFHNTI